jgi:glycosyltransferase involved in cell wall biosynthesis
VRPIVALHREGHLSRRLASSGIAFHVVPGLPEDLTRRPGRPDSLSAVPRNARALPRAVEYLRELATRESASVLYGQGTWANVVSAFAARGSEVAAVWHIRNDFRPIVKRLVIRAVARACRVRAIVAVSRSAAGPLEGLKAPLHVVHNGADLDACDAAMSAPDDLRRRLGIPRGAVVACYAGRLLPHKGIHVLMEAARLAMGRSPSLHLVILGDSPAHAPRDVRRDLAQRAAEWGLGDRIHLPGWVPAVERALVGFDFVVIPSTCRECCSRSLVESLCLGMPVVASDVGGNPELLRHGEDGLLVPPGDPEPLAQALAALASEAPLRRRLAMGALRARDRFDSASVARRVAAILKETAGDGSVARTRKGLEPVQATR